MQNRFANSSCLTTVIALAAAMALHAQAVPVVANAAPDPDAPAFRLSSQPIVALGGLNDDERYEFRALPRAALTSTGRLLVHARYRDLEEVRVFGLDGKYQRTIGRKGKGPGEFDQIYHLVPLRADTFAVFDNLQRRLTLFDAASGRILREISGPGAGECCFVDGSLLARRPLSAQPIGPPAQERQPPPTYVWSIATRSDEPVRDVLTTRGSDPGIYVGGFLLSGPLAGQLAASGVTAAVNPVTRAMPFGREAWVRLTGETIVYAVNERYEYSVFARDGTPLRIVRSAAPTIPVTGADLERARGAFMAGASTPERETAHAAAWSRIDHYPTLPAFGRILTEFGGAVWVQCYDGDLATDQWWAKFDASGRLLGTLRIPPNRRVHQLDHGYAVLTWRDAIDDTRRVAVHRIEPVR